MNKNDLKPEQWKMIMDLSQDVSVVSMILDIPEYKIKDWRHSEKYKDAIKEAGKRYKEKKRAEGSFSNGHATYDFWSAADIQYLMESEESAEAIATKLGRTICSVQKKRERLRKEGK